MESIEGAGSSPAEASLLESQSSEQVSNTSAFPSLAPRSILEDYRRFFCRRCESEYWVAPEDLEFRPCPKCDYGYWKGPILPEEIKEILFGNIFKGKVDEDHQR